MTTIKLRHTLFLVTIAAGMLAAGCELIVDFDRTLIPVAVLDGGTVFDAAGLNDAQGVLDAQQVDNDAQAQPEASTEGGAVDASTDTGAIADAQTDG